MEKLFSYNVNGNVFALVIRNSTFHGFYERGTLAVRSSLSLSLSLSLFSIFTSLRNDIRASILLDLVGMRYI